MTKDKNSIGGEGGVISSCKCDHEFQDKQHGKGKRVFTVGDKGVLHCTVCGQQKA